MAEQLQMAEPVASVPPAPHRRGLGLALFAILIAFVMGAGAVGYAAWKGLVPFQKASSVRLAGPGTPPAAAPSLPQPEAPDTAALAAHQSTLEGRMAALEQRLNVLNTQADAASGNAARAEALLVAFAARRALDRGAPLGYLEDQLRLRFGNTQPNAVATVIDSGKHPVTLDQLLAGLDSLAPTLTHAPATDDAWTRIKRELAGLFVIRRGTAPSPTAHTMLSHARILLETGRVEDAIVELGRLPGAAEAKEWSAAARRYDAALRALDVLESAAMLDGRTLRNGTGQPLGRTEAAPTATATPDNQAETAPPPA